MKKLFDLENPVFQAISRLTDLTVLGLLCLACCVPVVTFGPAVTALFRAVYDLTLERGGGAVKTYFRAFRDNFKQAAAAGLLGLLVLAALVCDFLLLKLYYQGTAYHYSFLAGAVDSVVIQNLHTSLLSLPTDRPV